MKPSNNSSPNRATPLLLLIGTLGAILVIAVWWLRLEHDGGKEHALNRGASTEVTGEIETSFPPPDFSYVGSAKCAECHAEIARSYSQHPMGKSLWEMESAPEIEDYHDTTFSPNGVNHYSVERHGNEVYHRERLVMQDGEVLFDQSVPIDYAVGSGAMGRSYLINREGILSMSPISWYTSKQDWSLSPGYELPYHRRFGRRVREACMDCHASRLNTRRREDNRFGDPPFLELSIGCERCHGPGLAHVKYRETERPLSGLDPIVNPAQLPPANREDVCAQCHLQGEGRVPHLGFEVGDYRPGQRLEETCVVFVKDHQQATGRLSPVLSQVEQMRTSICFLESEGKLGCISCHDPHTKPTEQEKIEFYRSRCLQCHEEQSCGLSIDARKESDPADSCYACHMPNKATSDIPHAAHTDHRILKINVRGGAKIDIDHESEIANPPVVFDNAETRLNKDIVNRALGIWMAHRAEALTNIPLATRAVLLLEPIVAKSQHDAKALEAIGVASAVLGRTEPAINYWRQTLTINKDCESSLRMLALTLDSSSRATQSLPYYQQYLRLNSTDAAIWYRYSGALQATEHSDKAIDAVLKAIKLDPSVPEYHEWLAHLYLEEGQEMKANESQSRARKIRSLSGSESSEPNG